MPKIRLTNNKKPVLNLLLSTTAVTVSLYVSEISLHTFQKIPKKSAAVPSKTPDLPADCDTRTPLDVLKAFRRAGSPVTLNIYPALFVGSDGVQGNKSALFPLAGISHAQIVYCNEQCLYVTYRSDEYGFNNPAGLHRRGDIAFTLVGDSFTQGACVQQDQTIAAHLRSIAKVPGVSLGIGANGPLIELATLREYSVPLRPRFVFWMYYEGNDIIDLDGESKTPLLMKYLGDFTQHLADRQGEIDAALTNYAEERIDEELRQENRPRKQKAPLPASHPFLQILRLESLSKAIQRFRQDLATHQRYDLFEQIIRKAKNLTETNGGTFVFVYLPMRERYETSNQNPDCFQNRKKVMQLVQGMDIPVIDIHREFENSGDPLGLFPFRFHPHYTSDGYRIVALALNEHIQKMKDK